MSQGELEVLGRAHQLFAAAGPPATLIAVHDAPAPGAAVLTGAGGARYQLAVSGSRAALRSAADTDAAVATVVGAAHHDHLAAHHDTKRVLDEARADRGTSNAPLAQREAVRRRVARLHAQRRHVLSARARARRHSAALRALRYRALRRRAARFSPACGRAGVAVRAALSKLGRPYVWGATGPGQFDCSGLVQWSYAQAGIRLSRTTYQQIHEGIPVPRWQARPGDLVFPHPGHVQMCIGNNLVVEAPHAGATVRISRLGDHVQIRRPLP
ncbi:C40 family peptidase [Mycobacterium shimoidei]|uniref:Secreted protein P60-related protein [Mycobacterium tuberculosis H37Rv] n=1 Tax=Mycobacterium shimoidei TaxID=29313 RepID=A0A1E3TL95_MYCSH|nr:C40 family peptidase [Mycobacterium shimoidei]MCV7258851.1 C40 family peptidase [Mycobacterium shimoidei]ODR15257.1 hypothetical protein BHQ16_00440 [Mycobacterium shimoidei]ORW79840.1 hypothetical protein AWC26_13035 [Mycobacterium shimoidei]SRX92910.1 Putative secreted protein P60-related protein [Mycobacterium tuberculosis H37Rv] [Mycobacterium shimoidei]